MGIKGLAPFLGHYRYKQTFRLHHTKLVINGDNLQYKLFERFLLQCPDYRLFGGDYTRLSIFYRSFFNKLHQCHIEPIVIFDCSVDCNQQELQKYIDRFDQRLKHVFEAYQGLTLDEKTLRQTLQSFHALHNHDVFVQVLKSMNIIYFTIITAADSVIPQIAYDLKCPVLSQDNDHLVYNLPGGAINFDSFYDAYDDSGRRTVTDNIVVYEGNFQQGRRYNYLLCKLYKLSNIIKDYPTMELDLVHLVKAIIGNYNMREIDVENFCQAIQSTINCRTHELKNISQFYAIFEWLSRLNSYDEIKRSLEEHFGEEHEVLRNLEEELNKLNVSKKYDFKKITVRNYFYMVRGEIFKSDEHVPDWVDEQFIEARFNRRFMSILKRRLDQFRPLMEDFSLNDSSYECTLELNKYIYGILRRKDDESPITLYVRKRDQRIGIEVIPLFKLKDEDLPVLIDMDVISEKDRIDLFLNILEMDRNLIEVIKGLLPDSDSQDKNSDKKNQFVTLIFSLIYMCRKFSEDLWIEFCYALLVNILFMGHFLKDNINIRLPKLVDLDLANRNHTQVRKKLLKFDKISATEDTFKARIVHFYNAYQNCLNNICFLAQLLDISKNFHVDEMIVGLQGSFIYNLTMELGKQQQPLLHVEQDLLGSDRKCQRLFKNALDLVMGSDQSFRIYLPDTNEVVENSTTRTIVPEHVQQSNSNDERKEYKLFIQGMKDVKKKTDIFHKEINMDEILGSST